MNDKSGQLYQTFAGLLGGASVGTLIPLLGDLKSPDAQPAMWWVIVLIVLTALCAYVLAAVFCDWWLPGRRPRAAGFVEEAYRLSGEISAWVSERRQDEPTHDFDDWEKSTARGLSHSTATMSRWNQRFGPQALVVFDGLMAAGAFGDDPPVDRTRVEHPTNILGIEDVARSLWIMAAQTQQKLFSRN